MPNIDNFIESGRRQRAVLLEENPMPADSLTHILHLALAIRNRGYTNKREQRLAEKSAWYCED
ncbi:hypothetical protein [Nostoc sp. CALU 546]|uniref:hypothetical protein n=1 Tax=Nostoc sp. CALU 546 TaxID=1867241 RepID=UPI003B66D2B7